MPNNDYIKLLELQDLSIEKILELLYSGELEGDYQFPFHMGYQLNKGLEDALKRVKEELGTENPKFVDCGCCDGFSLIIANNAGYHSYGIEIEPSLAGLARSNLKKAVECGLIYINLECKVITGNILTQEAYNVVGQPDIYLLFLTPSLTEKKLGFLNQYAQNGARILILDQSSSEIKSMRIEDSFHRIGHLWTNESFSCFQIIGDECPRSSHFLPPSHSDPQYSSSPGGP